MIDRDRARIRLRSYLPGKEDASYYLSCYTSLTEGRGRGTQEIHAVQNPTALMIGHAIKR